MDNSISISISLSKGSINEEMSMYRASMEDADGLTGDAISNESICKGDEILDTYKVTSDAIRGGMGSVWRVHHKGWGIDLAMKPPAAEILCGGLKASQGRICVGMRELDRSGAACKYRFMLLRP